MLITIRKMKTEKADRLKLLPSLFYITLPMPFLRLNGSVPVAAIIGLVICIICILKRRFFVDNYMVFVLFFFAIGEALALTNGINTSKTITYTLQKFIIVLTIYPTIMITLKDPRSIRLGVSYFKYGCLFVIIISLIAYVFRVNISFVATKYATGRLIIAGMGPNVIARLFCIGALIALYQAQVTKGREHIINYIEFVICSLGILATISVSGFLLLFVGSIFIYLKFNEGVHKFGILKVIFILVLFCLLLVLLYHNVPFVQTQVQKLLLRAETNRMLDNINEGFSLHGRLSGLENYAQNAIRYCIAGVGYGNSSFLAGKTIHFPILAALVETGLFGLISCAYMYGFAFFASIKLLKNSSFAFYGILSITIILGDMVQPNPNYVFTWFAIFLSICAYRIMND